MASSNEHDQPDLLIAGASTRAAAFSAIRAGLKPICVDLFADVDLTRCCAVERLQAADFPSGIAQAARLADDSPWMYVGALENHPELVDLISRRRALWGNAGNVLKRVRNPFEVSRHLTGAGIKHPAVRSAIEPLPDSEWLLKPIDGAGGRGIRPVVAGVEVSHASGRYYFQQRIDGLPYAAVFVAFRTSATLVGLTRQLVGDSFFQAKPFHYCGSIGPVSLDLRLRQQLERLGQLLVAEFQLVGIFGIDGIIRDDDFWPVEVNPRYTASVEVLELASRASLMAHHRDACMGVAGRAVPTSLATRVNSTERIVGKAVLYAGTPAAMPDLCAECGEMPDLTQCWRIPTIADIPRPGERIDSGPICTVFASGQSERTCESALRDRARRVYERIHGA